MSRFSLAWIGIVSLATIGCGDSALPPPNAMSQGPEHKVVVDLAALGIDPATHVAGSRKAEEEAAMARLLALYSPEQAQQVAHLFAMADSMGWGIYYERIENEEEARLLSVIHTIRTADQKAKDRELLAQRGLRFERKK